VFRLSGFKFSISLTLLNDYFYGIARLLADFGTDVFAKSDSVADRAIGVLDTHIDDPSYINA